MSFDSSPLINDVRFVMAQPNPRAWRWLHASFRIQGRLTPALKVISFDEIEDYANGFGAERLISVYVGLGFYAKQLHPHRHELELVLQRSVNDPEPRTVSEVYEVVLVEGENPTIDAEQYANVSEIALDISDLIEVNLQLKHKALDQLRAALIGGIYREERIENVLRASFSQVMGELEMEDSYQPLGVDIADGVNDTTYEQIIIPHGTKLVDLPGYLQEKQYGIYPAGMGHFYKDGFWFIYPLFDTTRFNQARSTLDITLVPANILVGVNSTYRTQGSVSFILATGERELDNTTEHEKQDKGEGVRFADPDGLFGAFLDVSSQENKAIVSRARAGSEITSGENPDFTNAPMATQHITANKFRELSRLAQRQGQYFTCVWEYSNPDTTQPGMMCRVKYFDQGMVRSFEGVLVGAAHSTQLVGKGMVADTYLTSTLMTIFITQDLDT